MNPKRLSMWTVFDHPADYPDVFVARRFEVGAPHEGDSGVIRTDEVMTSHELEHIRTDLADRGLTCLPRFERDDPNIIEVWM